MAQSQERSPGPGSVRPSFSSLLQNHHPQGALPDMGRPSFSSTPSGLLSSTSSSSLLTFSSNDLEDWESTLLWTLQEPSTIALTIMYCLSFILGFVGNLTSLRVLTNRRNQRLASVSATRSLLVNLAVCDLAVVCVCMPVTLGSRIYTAWVYGDLLCRAVPFTQALSVSASVLTLTVISVNRYYSVKWPLRALSMFTRRRLRLTVVLVWAVSFTMCAPMAVVNRQREISFGTFAIWVCQEEWPLLRLKQGYNVLLFIMLYCLPVAFNLTIGFLTGRRLWRGNPPTFTELDPRSQALQNSRLKIRQKIVRMVVSLVLLFAVSWLPLYLADLWIDCQQRPPSWLLQTRPFAQWLGLTNSSLNPICYCLIGDLYRSARLFRSRYYQKVASLFGSAAFSGSPLREVTHTRVPVGDHHNISADSVSVASACSVNRLGSELRCCGPRLSESSVFSSRLHPPSPLRTESEVKGGIPVSRPSGTRTYGGRSANQGDGKGEQEGQEEVTTCL